MKTHRKWIASIALLTALFSLSTKLMADQSYSNQVIADDTLIIPITQDVPATYTFSFTPPSGYVFEEGSGSTSASIDTIVTTLSNSSALYKVEIEVLPGFNTVFNALFSGTLKPIPGTGKSEGPAPEDVPWYAKTENTSKLLFIDDACISWTDSTRTGQTSTTFTADYSGPNPGAATSWSIAPGTDLTATANGDSYTVSSTNKDTARGEHTVTAQKDGLTATGSLHVVDVDVVVDSVGESTEEDGIELKAGDLKAMSLSVDTGGAYGGGVSLSVTGDIDILDSVGEPVTDFEWSVDNVPSPLVISAYESGTITLTYTCPHGSAFTDTVNIIVKGGPEITTIDVLSEDAVVAVGYAEPIKGVELSNTGTDSVTGDFSVTYTKDGAAGTLQAATSVTVAGDGTYNWSVPTGLSAGIYNCTATWAVTDADGNNPITTEFTVTVVRIDSILVKRTGSSEAFSSSTTIAAGGLDSDVHSADVELTISPVPTTSGWSVDVPITATGIAGENTDGVLTIGSSSVTGSITITESDVSSSGTLIGTYVSCDKVQDATISSTAGGSATVTQAWDDETDETAEWDYKPYFEYDTYEPVSITLEIDEQTPIDSHDVRFSVTAVSYDRFDVETAQWISHEGVTEGLGIFSEFVGSNDGDVDGNSTTDANGTATARQIVYSDPNDFTIVYEVKFKVEDQDAY